MSIQAPAPAVARSFGMSAEGAHESCDEVLRVSPDCDPPQDTPEIKEFSGVPEKSCEESPGKMKRSGPQ